MNILDELAIKYGTDKGPRHHNYTPTYFSYFEKMRNEPLKILEIGVHKGSSLMMWQDFFVSSSIYGIDKGDTSFLNKDRIKTFKGDQTNTDFLLKVHKEVGPFDIIIDDGSHIVDHQITTFQFLFECLTHGGIYVIEDTSTSYWDEFINKSKPQTCIQFLKDRIDDIHFHGYKYNNTKIANRDVLVNKKPNCNIFERYIKSIHFYIGLAFIFKN